MAAWLSQGMPRLQSKAQELRQYLSDHTQQHFSQWVDAVEEGLRDEASGLSFRLKGKLMEVRRRRERARESASERAKDLERG